MDSVHASAHALRTHSIGGQVESSGFRFEVQVKHISLTNKQKTHTTHTFQTSSMGLPAERSAGSIAPPA